MKIAEIFASIQGEGPLLGTPSLFIRFGGCILRCPFCDTKYAWNSEDERGLGELAEYPNNNHIKHIILTGGEPLINITDTEFRVLVKSFVKKGYDVTIETTMLVKFQDIIDRNIKQNYDLINNILGGEIMKKIRFVVSPKLDVLCYKDIDINMDTIMAFYKIDQHTASELANRGNLYYKLIYHHRESVTLRSLLEKLPTSWVEKYMYIMPMTPIPLLGQETEYKRNCFYAASFCIQHGIKYSPRAHIDIWGGKRGV